MFPKSQKLRMLGTLVLLGLTSGCSDDAKKKTADRQKALEEKKAVLVNYLREFVGHKAREQVGTPSRWLADKNTHASRGKVLGGSRHGAGAQRKRQHGASEKPARHGRTVLCCHRISSNAMAVPHVQTGDACAPTSCNTLHRQLISLQHPGPRAIMAADCAAS